MNEGGANIGADTVGELRLEKKMTLYHEAAHAVFMWNFGLEVERVVVDRSGLSGHVQPANYWSDGCGTAKRIAVILQCLAGGVAHRCFQTREEKDKLLCSSGDMTIVLNLIAMLDVHSKIAGIYVLRALVARTIQLVDVPEVQTQIKELVRLLRPSGCLLKRQVHIHLKSLPVSRTAIKLFKESVEEMNARLPALLKRAADEARQMADHPYYTNMLAMYDLPGVAGFTEP